MINIGGFQPGFQCQLNSTQIDSKIISYASSGTITGHFIDATKQTISYSGLVSASQYNIQIVPTQFVLFGQNPIIQLTTSPTGISSIDTLGNTTFLNTGKFSVTASYQTNSYYQGRNVSIDLINTSGGGAQTNFISYIPDPVNIANHVLVVYNTNSNDSINLKNYYTGKRPLFSGVNVLGITCASGVEQIPYTGYQSTIQTPIINYLTGISGSKPIRYIVMMSDIPTRTTNTNINGVSYGLNYAYQNLVLRNGSLDYNNQMDHFSLGKYQQNTLLCSYINFGTYNDCTAYIDKISAGQTGIYLTGNGNSNTYYFEDAGGYTSFPTWVSGRSLRPLLNYFPSVSYVYKPNPSGHITSGQNVAGYVTWGTNGGLANTYANNGTIKFYGGQNRYIMHTIESFDGQRNGGQGNFVRWFSSGAFGGTGYENCPIGAVGNIEEPFLGGTINTGYYILWESGFPLIECAWSARATPYFIVLGDPFIVK
jgi:hypothetical protein